MEVNIVIFISLLTMTPNFAAPQTSFQYFVVQRVGSAIFFFAFCSLAKITSGLLFHLAVMSLLLKTGSFPFFQWYSSVIERCS